MEKKKTMLLEFTQEEYDSIPSPKRTHVMRWLRLGRQQELIDGMDEKEVRWAFLVEGRCLSEMGRSKADAWRRLGFSEEDYHRITLHGSYDEAVRRGWWSEEKPTKSEGKTLDILESDDSSVGAGPLEV